MYSKEFIMDILIVMCIGVFIGNRFFPKKLRKPNDIAQVVCTTLLIFSMGVILGSRENFVHDLFNLGWTSFLFFLIPSVFSTILVFFLTKKFLPKQKNRREK